jgi:hypothetical protein
MTVSLLVGDDDENVPAKRRPSCLSMVMVNLTLENLGRRLVIEAASPRSLLAVLATLRPLEEDFPPIEELPLDAVDL